MASPEKIQEFLEASEAKKQCSTIMQQMLDQISNHFTEKEDEDSVIATELIRRLNQVIGEKIFEFLKVLYVDVFTDEDLDELIAIHTSPVFMRLRDMIPELNTKIVTYMLENQELWRAEIEKIIEEVTEEFEGNNHSSVH